MPFLEWIVTKRNRTAIDAAQKSVDSRFQGILLFYPDHPHFQF
jgi:hypothetical protein